MARVPKNTIDQMTLDRLTDGELDEQRRRDVIEALGNEDDGWKRCALAFLESQSFGQEISQMYRDERTSTMVQMSDPEKRGPAANHRPNFGWWLATAACVLIAFTLGARWQLDPVAPSSPSPMIAESSPIDGTQQQLSSFRQADIWKGESMLPADVETALERLGLEVNRKKGFVPVLSSDGNQMLVPYEDVRILPARHAPQ